MIIKLKGQIRKIIVGCFFSGIEGGMSAGILETQIQLKWRRRNLVLGQVSRLQMILCSLVKRFIS